MCSKAVMEPKVLLWAGQNSFFSLLISQSGELFHGEGAHLLRSHHTRKAQQIMKGLLSLQAMEEDQR